MAHGIEGDEIFPPQRWCRAVSEDLETALSRFTPTKRFPTLLLDTCKDYIFADVSPYLINTNFHDISIESGRM
jgi:hypothetical protein